MGIELKQPIWSLEDGVIRVSAKQRKDAVNVDEYCDNQWQELVSLHPELLQSHPGSPSASPSSAARIEKELDEVKDIETEWYYYLDRMVFGNWWPGRWMDLQLVSPFFHAISMHYPY
jgi:hypothetical protein